MGNSLKFKSSYFDVDKLLSKTEKARDSIDKRKAREYINFLMQFEKDNKDELAFINKEMNKQAALGLSFYKYKSDDLKFMEDLTDYLYFSGFMVSKCKTEHMEDAVLITWIKKGNNEIQADSDDSGHDSVDR